MTKATAEAGVFQSENILEENKNNDIFFSESDTVQASPMIEGNLPRRASGWGPVLNCPSSEAILPLILGIAGELCGKPKMASK